MLDLLLPPVKEKDFAADVDRYLYHWLRVLLCRIKI
jgi:hypothetical protein